MLQALILSDNAHRMTHYYLTRLHHAALPDSATPQDAAKLSSCHASTHHKLKLLRASPPTSPVCSLAMARRWKAGALAAPQQDTIAESDEEQKPQKKRRLRGKQSEVGTAYAKAPQPERWVMSLAGGVVEANVTSGLFA